LNVGINTKVHTDFLNHHFFPEAHAFDLTSHHIPLPVVIPTARSKMRVLSTMMSFSLLVILLILPADYGVIAFAPPSKSHLHRIRPPSSSQPQLSFSPLTFDVSSLISDATDAVATASSAADSGDNSFTPPTPTHHTTRH
jgi:hypothetical protein